MAEFIPGSASTSDKPNYAYIAYRCPKAFAVKRPDGVRQEGTEVDAIKWVPATPGMQEHHRYLVDVKGWDFVEHNLEPGHPLYSVAKHFEDREARYAARYSETPKRGRPKKADSFDE